VTVAAQADATDVTSTAAGAKRRRMGWFAAAAFAGALLGFLMAWLLLPNQNQALLKDLKVIRHADTLRQVENVDFLRRLAAEVPAERLMSDEVAIHNELAQMASLETRKAWVEALPSEDKVVLAGQAKRFGELEKNKKDQLLALQDKISAAGLDLQLLAYEQWLSRLTAGEQEDLRQNLLDRPVEAQVKLVRQLVRQESEQASRQLSDEDAETLQKNLRAIAADRKVELMASPKWRAEGDRSRPPVALTMIARELFRNDETRKELRDQLMKGLSPKAHDQLASLSGGRRNFQLWRWILDSMPTRVDSDELERFFAEKLKTDQREKLLSLPPKEMQASLERLYYATELGYGDVAEWWSQFRESGWPPNWPGERRGFRPDGPPGERGRQDGPDEFKDGERRRPRPRGPGGPGSPPRPGERDFRDDRRPSFEPPDGPRPGPPPKGPPPEGPPPRDDEGRPEEI
jgi:hypothetical protein